ncbi:rho-associated protein kinase 2-like [Amphiura filiformis]|uniref:rho-associated protein kinase 2-like n=1 Tax=Amphiura filiformis TaxID=82378 RepID=UPI003B220F7F
MFESTDLKAASQQITIMKVEEKRLHSELSETREKMDNLKEQLDKTKQTAAIAILQIRELQEQLESDQDIIKLYKNRNSVLKEQVEEKEHEVDELNRINKALQNERDPFSTQFELKLTKADSEQLASSISEEQYRSDLDDKNIQISKLEDCNKELNNKLKVMGTEKDEIYNKLKELQSEYDSIFNDNANIEEVKKQYEKKLEMEKMLKIQAVNKLAEVMQRKDWTKDAKKPTSSTLRREKELRKLQQELSLEREKYGQMANKYMRENTELQAQYNEEYQKRCQIQRDLDSRDSELGQLQLNHRTLQNMLETTSISSMGDSDGEGISGWLDIPGKNLKRHGWKRHFVEASSKKILFYESEDDKNNKKPYLVLDIDKLLHVRAVTHGDVIRADAKDIPRIFQLLYVGEGENRKIKELPQLESQSSDDKSSIIQYKRHEFVVVHFHMHATCEYCHKTLSSVIKPPPALECQLCHVKVHKDHFDKNEEFSGPCKVNIDTNTSKDMLLRATTAEEQQRWISKLHKQIIQHGCSTVL